MTFPLDSNCNTDVATDPVLAAIGRFFAQTGTAAAPGEVLADLALLESGLIDSLSMLQLTTYLSDTFGIEFTDEDFTEENFATAGALARLVRNHQAGGD